MAAARVETVIEGPSRQLPVAAQPDALLGFHSGHLEQKDQHAEPMAPRQPGQIGNGFSNEGGGLVRPAIPRRILNSRAAIPAPGSAGSAPPCLGQ
jgi:hypothetical protein